MLLWWAVNSGSFVGAVASTHALNCYSLLPDSAHAFLCCFVAAVSNWQRRCCYPPGMAPSNCTPCMWGTVGLAAFLGQSGFYWLLTTRWMLTVEHLFVVGIKLWPLVTLIRHHFKDNSVAFILSSVTNVLVTWKWGHFSLCTLYNSASCMKVFPLHLQLLEASTWEQEMLNSVNIVQGY